MQPIDEAKARLSGIFDRASATYGQVGPGHFTYFGLRLVEWAEPAPGMQALDVACGRGAVLFPLAAAIGPSGAVVGIDLSEGMVAATRAEIAARGLSAVSAQVMDAERLTFPDASFDIITCGLALFFLSDQDAALRGFRRALRPGGRLAVSVWSPQIIPTEQVRWSWFEDLVKSYQEPSAQSPEAHPVNRKDTPDVLVERFRHAGFSDVVVHEDAATFRYDSPEDWWQERWSVYFRGALEALSADQLADLQARALHHAAEMQARGDLLTELKAIYVIGR